MRFMKATEDFESPEGTFKAGQIIEVNDEQAFRLLRTQPVVEATQGEVDAFHAEQARPLHAAEPASE